MCFDVVTGIGRFHQRMFSRNKILLRIENGEFDFEQNSREVHYRGRMQSMTLDLDYLLTQGNATENEVVEQLVGQFYTPLRRLARSLLGDDGLAADVAQATIIKAANRIGQYQMIQPIAVRMRRHLRMRFNLRPY